MGHLFFKMKLPDAGARSSVATQLTELEREYLHKRIEEERAEVASLEFARAAEAAQAKETVTVPNPLPPHASPPVLTDS